MLSAKTRQLLFLGFVALVLTGALWRLFSGSSTDSSLDGDTRTQVILAVLYGGVVLLAFQEFRWTGWLMLRSPALCSLLAVACLSPLWAETPDLVFRRSISLLGTSLFGVILAARLTIHEQLRLVRTVLRLAAVACLTLFLVAPQYATATDFGTGSARGVFPHKNLFGAAMALGILVEWYASEEGTFQQLVKFVSMGLFAALLVLSHSVTSIVTVASALLIMWLFERFHRRYHVPLPAILFFLVGLVVCIVLFGIDTSMFTEMMGRSKDLTGRTDLWQSVGSMILARPLLGYGFSGFWGGASMESYAVENYVGWSPTYSHNGYLEVLLNLGIVGTGFLLIFLWRGLTHCLYKAQHKKEKEDLWPLAFLVFFIVHNFAECTIVWQNCLEWALCIATVIAADPQVQSMLSDSAEQPYAFLAAPGHQYALESGSSSEDSDGSSSDQFAPER
jgi:exopolysaccharide production protein ExoQ